MEWGHIAFVCCYISPNCNVDEYESYVESLGNCIRRCQPRPTIALGDFNAHSREWGGRRENAKGRKLIEWAASINLTHLNQGSVNTCVRWQGESIVDLTRANTSAARIVK